MALRARTLGARRLRRDATDAERALWRSLRDAKLPFRIRRQHPIGSCIVDFAVPACKLVIEIDGGQHARAAEADARRAQQLATHGYRVIRFWNHQVLGNPHGVLQAIRAELGRGPHPARQ
jgi:BirA family biotin operon repressor/biotin-[acetyl-CoA-carboxylase] ligase